MTAISIFKDECSQANRSTKHTAHLYVFLFRITFVSQSECIITEPIDYVIKMPSISKTRSNQIVPLPVFCHTYLSEYEQKETQFALKEPYFMKNDFINFSYF